MNSEIYTEMQITLRLLYVTRKTMKKKFLRVQEENVSWPLKNEESNANITQVEASDLLYDKGGCAFLSAGGPGSSSVTLHLASQRSGALDFIINVYGFGY